MGRVLPFAPLDLIDLLFDLQRLEVIELWLVGLKLGVKLVLASLFLPRKATWTGQNITTPSRKTRLRGRRAAYHLIALEEDDTATLVTSGKVITGRVELYTRYDVGCVPRASSTN